jgi:hypothetical protein
MTHPLNVAKNEGIVTLGELDKLRAEFAQALEETVEELREELAPKSRKRKAAPDPSPTPDADPEPTTGQLPEPAAAAVVQSDSPDEDESPGQTPDILSGLDEGE